MLLSSHESIYITDVKTFADKVCQFLICKYESSKRVLCFLYRLSDAPYSSLKRVFCF